MTSRTENSIIVFHSYPTKPCIDGLMSVIILAENNQSKIKLVPYWRTETSFQRVKKTVDSVGLGNTSIIYVDCAPDLDEEVDYLQTIINKVDSIKIYDHHVKKTSPMYRLIQENNFHSKIDPKICAAKLLHKHVLNNKQKYEFKQYYNLMTLIHFSDYEGMDPALSEKQEAGKIAKAAFKNAIKRIPASKCQHNLERIKKMRMSLYYILDNIMAERADWKFLYNDELSDDDIYERFSQQKDVYLRNAVSAVSGDNQFVYNEGKTTEYLHLLEDMEKKLKRGYVLKCKQIGMENVDVFVCHIDIFIYGRSLEPYVQNEMKHRGASYAILINNPTVNNQRQQMYYFSLRRVNKKKENNAMDLADYVMNVSGTTIGGGHPWASGATLNDQQYRKFIEVEGLGDL